MALALLEEVAQEYPLDHCRLAAFTGMGGKTLAQILGGTFVNEVIALARGTLFLPRSPDNHRHGGRGRQTILVDEEEGTW